MSTLIRFILTFSLLTFLLFSQSLPTSSAAADGGGQGEGKCEGEGEGEVVLVPFRRVLLSRQLPVKAAAGDDLPHKLGIHMRKVRSGGGVATRARGKTSSSAAPTQFSSFHFASLLAYTSFFLALILL